MITSHFEQYQSALIADDIRIILITKVIGEILFKIFFGGVASVATMAFLDRKMPVKVVSYKRKETSNDISKTFAGKDVHETTSTNMTVEQVQLKLTNEESRVRFDIFPKGEKKPTDVRCAYTNVTLARGLFGWQKETFSSHVIYGGSPDNLGFQDAREGSIASISIQQELIKRFLR